MRFACSPATVLGRSKGEVMRKTTIAGVAGALAVGWALVVNINAAHNEAERASINARIANDRASALRDQIDDQQQRIEALEEKLGM